MLRTNPIIYIETPDSPAAQLAHALAARLSAEPVYDPETAARAALAVRAGPDGLSLSGRGLSVRGDFSAMKGRLRPNEVNRELLVRAARCRGTAAPAALDATAGMGEDSILLAAAGFHVTMFEQDPVIAALLEDALRRGLEDPATREIVSRMHLLCGDSITAMRTAGADQDGSGIPAPDVIYLDPMFPERTKSGLVKKKFQLIHELERPCNSEEELLAAAIAAGPRKIVIKRPRKAPPLGGKEPSYTLSGKKIRYDVIALR